MKKLTTGILAIVLSSSFVVLNAQQTKKDSVKTQNIEEVVVTGALGIKKKLDAVTASSQIVGAKELGAASNPNAVQSLTGKVAGLQITTTDVGVNSTNKIVLRGARSITGDNQALIVIDNVISSSSVFQQLPPDAIENVNVIKGLQGAALYGSQGVNGVIVVTTKKGTKSQKVQFNLNSSVEVSSVFKLPKIQTKYGQGVQDDTYSSVDYNGTNVVPWENTSWGPSYNDPTVGGQMIPTGLPQADGNFRLARYAPVDNHFGKFFKNGVTFQNGVSLNVGGSDSYAYLNLNRTNSDFMVEGDNLLKNSFLFKAGKKMGKFRIDGDFNYIYKATTETSHGLYGEMIQMPSNIDIRTFRNSGLEGNYSAYSLNPYWTTQNERYNSKTNYISAVIGLGYEFNDHISLTYKGSLQNTMGDFDSHNNGFKFTRMYDGTGTGIDGTYFSDYGHGDVTSFFRQSTSKSSNYYGDLLLNLDYDLSDNINLKLNTGINTQDNNYRINEVGGDNLKTPGWYNYSNVLQPYLAYQLNNYQLRNRVFAALANLDLAYKNYLYFNGTYRQEWNSVLSVRPTDTGVQDVRSYGYYSAGLSFIPTNAFEGLKGDFLNYAKVSLSYTGVGNSPIAAYAVDQIGAFPIGYPFGSNTAYIANQTPTSENIKPEKITTKEANLILGFFRDRLTITGSYSQSNTKDLITRVTTSSTSGLSNLQNNFGKMVNNTYELELGITPIKSKDVELNVRAYYSSSIARIKELPTGVDEVNLLSYATPGVGIFAVKGEKFPLIKGTKFERDPNGNIIVDSKGNPLTSSTFEVLGKAMPDYTLGLNLSLRVKGFTLSGTADYRKGASFVSMTKRTLMFTGADPMTADFDRSKGYVVPNSVQLVNGNYVTNTTTVGDSPDYNGVMSYFTGAARNVGEALVVDGTALKVRELSLSYAIPKSLLESTFVNTASLGVYARNPFIKYADNNLNYNDPETASSSGNASGIALDTQYPNYRTFGFNLNVTF